MAPVLPPHHLQARLCLLSSLSPSGLIEPVLSVCCFLEGAAGPPFTVGGACLKLRAQQPGTVRPLQSWPALLPTAEQELARP